MIFLDAGICIFLFAGLSPRLNERVAQQDAGTLVLSTVTFAELVLGSARERRPELSLLDAFLGQVALLPFDEAAARAYATLPFRRAGLDRLLAAHALSLDATVVSNNVRDYADVPGLQVENWTLPPP